MGRLRCNTTFLAKMKSFKFFFVTLLICLSCKLVEAAPNEIPAIVLTGLKEYKTSGVTNGVDAWLKESPLENEGKSRLNIQSTISRVELAYGKCIGWERVRTLDVSKSVCRIYIVIKFEKGPLFSSFDCYRANDKWIIVALDFNTQLQTILP
jgi:hypothetical protein